MITHKCAIEKSSTMERKSKQDIYMTLLFNFISAPSVKSKAEQLQRRRSFEYMELTDKAKNTMVLSKDETAGNESKETHDDTNREICKDKLANSKPGNDQHEYFARFNYNLTRTSVNGECNNSKNQSVHESSKPILECLASKKNTCSIDTTNCLERSSIKDEGCLLSANHEQDNNPKCKPSLTSKIVPISIRVQDWVDYQPFDVNGTLNAPNHCLVDNDVVQPYDYPTQFIPTLSCIEETDESEENWQQCPDDLDKRSQSLGWSTELLSTYSAEGSLRRTRTLESLNTLDDDDYDDSETAELGQDDSGNYSQQEKQLKSDCENQEVLRAGNCCANTVTEARDPEMTQKSVTQNKSILTTVDEQPAGTQTEQMQPENNYMNSLNSRSTHSSYTIDSAYSSRERLNTLYSSILDVSDESYNEEDFLEYIPVSYAGTRPRKKRRWVVRSASDIYHPSNANGDTAIDKFNTIKKRLTRTLSRRGKKPNKQNETEDGATAQPNASPKLSPVINPHVKKGMSRKKSFRKTVLRFLRRVRRRDFQSNGNLRDRSWSMPTKLNEA
ncbi:unnamed protein product [Clavelina lepadiformis]|uniref:Uncharacterized protein n=1 Tax=Clavelina lepadiformis TaxID=159417 RepID=A0ABP0EXB0_CLALP